MTTPLRSRRALHTGSVEMLMSCIYTGGIRSGWCGDREFGVRCYDVRVTFSSSASGGGSDNLIRCLGSEALLICPYPNKVLSVQTRARC